jgi:hypothetical protein
MFSENSDTDAAGDRPPSFSRNSGGSSRDRRRKRRANERIAKIADAVASRIASDQNKTTEISPLPEEAQPPTATIAERFLAFFDHASFQTLASIVGGLIGTFLDGRYYCCLSVLVSFGLHRSKALADIAPKFKLLIHLVSVGLACYLLFYMGVQINKSRPHVYTPQDYSNAVKNNLSLPVVQHITNVYQTYMREKKSGPRIDFSEFQSGGSPINGIFPLTTESWNSGDEPALNVRDSAHTLFSDRSLDAENSLFSFLNDHADDKVQPTRDQASGQRLLTPVSLPIPSLEEAQQIQAGHKVLYVGLITRYNDAAGNVFQSEICMFMTYSSNFVYCDHHNGVHKLSKGINQH